MRVFITGGTGFLGTYLARRLCVDGHEVHLFSRHPGHGPGNFHKGDVTDRKRLLQVVNEVRPEWIFHLAADLEREKSQVRRETEDPNLFGAMNIISAALEVRAQALVAAGSFSEYGRARVPYEEARPIDPVSLYGLTKSWATSHIIDFGSMWPATVLRFSVVYGKGQRKDTLLGALFSALKTNMPISLPPGEQTRDFIYIDDAVEALVLAAKKIATCRGQIINVCSGQEVKVKEVVRLVEDVSGRKGFAELGRVAYRKDEQMRYVGSTEKMKKLLQFEPKVDLEEGIRRLFQSP
ncbi:NAD-dependent epimerase/dehydratase family protein [Candidatus Parcubacteria bacterium]|nr:NAD-dependent epimerase/dehydratase family protein [Candidatus Parcubacteria bacterium]